MAKRESFDPSAGLFTNIIDKEDDKREIKQISKEITNLEVKKSKPLGRPTAPDLKGEEIVKISVYIGKDQLQNLRMFRAIHSTEYKDQSQIVRAALKEFLEK